MEEVNGQGSNLWLFASYPHGVIDMKILHRRHDESVPMLESARMQGNPKSWSSEQLERLLTPREIDQVIHHQV